MERSESSRGDFTDELRHLIARGRRYSETPDGLRLLETLSASMLVTDASRAWTLLGLDVLIFGKRGQVAERLKLWSEMLRELSQDDLVESLAEVGRLANAVFVTPAWIRAHLLAEEPEASALGVPRAAAPAHDSALLLALGLLVEIAAVDAEPAAPMGGHMEDDGEPILV
jgi:hypothetical protein